ncbi:hypothetical protein DQ04_02321080 [Trypanosoma grayi]|uniref:hypothetical protein n=1 Tax=Trypanosoma grayi TaxID=71804 RepID=UPI0004F3F5AA|nr:hypothetical protein DQ04_02321080 [Trypanosoma grayi]KEG11744.1 hypothetical protein DQ04_02321080 [Trypanosoma grayi]
MTSLNTELALVKRLHMLSKNYDNRPVIARRNTLPTLVRFLGSNDRETRQYSLAALHMLAQHPENVELLSGDRALVKEVHRVYKDAECDDPELHELANQILNCLEPVLQNNDPRKEEARSANMGSSSSNGNLDSSAAEDGFSLTRRARAARVLRGVGSDAIHTVVLDIPALDPRNVDDLATIEDIFQTTRGVLSYSVFVENKQARLFLTCETQAVQQVLSDSGFESIVVRDDVVGQDVFGGPGAGGSGGTHLNNNNNNRSYYDGDVSRRQPSYLESFTNSIYKTALVLRGGGSQTDTLSSRVQQQHAREQHGTSTLRQVANTLSKWW